uniref:TIL domain-containing protein n=1 Tax=Syphacia muris TaxID=451379 RepID=A0A158R606_9BILA
MFAHLLLITAIFNYSLSQRSPVEESCLGSSNGGRCGKNRATELSTNQASRSSFGNRRAEASRTLYRKLLQKYQIISGESTSNSTETATASTSKSNNTSVVNTSQKDTAAAPAASANSVFSNSLDLLKNLKMADTPENPFDSLSSDSMDNFENNYNPDRTDSSDDNLDTFRFSNFDGYKGSIEDDKVSTLTVSPEHVKSEPTEEESNNTLSYKAKHPVPCTPDCDQKVWPHCTQECKCDYIYPTVQRFCNPPPMPFFLNTCRLWYAGCPKYHRYHYTSQYFISQANKDRISPTNSPVTPYGILTSNPTPETMGTFVPQQKSKVARDEATSSGSFRNRQKNDDSLSSTSGTHSLHTSSTHQPTSTKESELMTDDYTDIEDAEFHKFDQLSEAALSYRPQRPSSIYTKPGLWDANPANPHNRDHANKYWYNPKSVEADWLHGQVTWGGHWSVPAFGVGGSDGYSVVFFPSIGQFLGIEDDYDA